jgi:hypothetical protein
MYPEGVKPAVPETSLPETGLQNMVTPGPI